MDMLNKKILKIERLLSLHKNLLAEDNATLKEWDVRHVHDISAVPDTRGKLSIYVLLKENYPVYLGRSVNASLRINKHREDKDFDSVFVSSSMSESVEAKVLSYIEFLCFYALWSSGYCLIYNSSDVWNTLPLHSQKGPNFNSFEISFAHKFVNSYLVGLGNLDLSAPEPVGQPLELRYIGKKDVNLRAIYWRPTIKSDLQDIAAEFWDKKLEERKRKSKNPGKLRCSFAGSGAFFIMEDTKGLLMKNDYDQQATYDLLRKIGVFREVENHTIWLSNYPFPKSKLMLHLVQAANSANARREIVEPMSNRYLYELEDDWRVFSVK